MRYKRYRSLTQGCVLFYFHALQQYLLSKKHVMESKTVPEAWPEPLYDREAAGHRRGGQSPVSLHALGQSAWAGTQRDLVLHSYRTEINSEGGNSGLSKAIQFLFCDRL